MNIQQTLDQLKQQYQVLAVVNLDQWTDNYETSKAWLLKTCQELHRSSFTELQRMVFIHTKDYYVGNTDRVGLILKNLQIIINEVDISNFFIAVITTNPDLVQEELFISKLSHDPVPFTFVIADGNYHTEYLKKHPYSRQEHYQYGSVNPVKINLNDVTDKEKFLLADSRVFCMYPWIHLHAWPTGHAYPCCYATHHPVYGNTKKESLKEIWNGEPMRQLRRDMLSETPNPSCAKCHEQEDNGFFSGRQSANKHHGHQIHRIAQTQPDGRYDDFQMTYWDIRFSNLCNLKCRSCGHIFSSQWYQDQAKIAGGDWAKKHQVLNFAGRTEIDMWEQLLPHLDYVEQIYFAGGEPLMMAEHYNILDELERRGRFDVRLIYNTNFTQTKLKDREVFDYWKKFESVAVGASLDGSDSYAEYIRKGTKWDTVIRNREEMMRICPGVDFYISPTLSILNALHLPDFHRDWVTRGYIQAQDLNVNILQDPLCYRIDVATTEYKETIKQKYQEHLEWLRPLDPLQRATVGFESAINYMMATDNSQLIKTFWEKTRELDAIRNEDVLEIIPELKALQ